MLAPHPAYGWEFATPLFAEGLKLGFGILGRGGSVNALEIGSDQFAILAGDEVQAVAHHMHNAQLDLGLQVDALDRVRKAGEAVHAWNQDVADAAISEFGQHLQPEFGAPGLGNPQPQKLRHAGRAEPQRQVNRLPEPARDRS